MNFKLVWTRPALRDMKKLDTVRARRMREGLTHLALTGEGDVVRLKDVKPPEWRLKVGDRRAFFRFNYAAKEIEVLRVSRRDHAYDR